MTAINRYLFVYGTLLAQGNPYAAYLQQHCRLVGEGKFRGRLYDIGEYPAAINDINSNLFVYGSIYLMDDAVEILSVIDEYEGIGPSEPEPHEYTRSLTNIETENGIVACWVYIYKWPLEGKFQITKGDYLQYFKQKQ
ncbi:gamma-glutamylcyclotransferase [Mucilaginibacter sp. AW1-7]|uniref:gamma-glutamylcyclotransferase family protein n=1 Tax=Mucilaginibacter sp. AW1-7 TaxID=3349874 RepID=UPI003F73730C